jgi:hypothetical protein
MSATICQTPDRGAYRIFPATVAVSNPFTAVYGKTDIEAIAPDAVPGDVEAAKIRAIKTIA